MQFILDLKQTFSQFSTTNIFLSIIVTLLGFFLAFKKVNNEIKKNQEDIKNSHIENLLHQIEILSKELDKTRVQLSDLHSQYIELMEQFRKANNHISHLEYIITNCNCGQLNDNQKFLNDNHFID